jgi:hypothetical protein
MTPAGIWLAIDQKLGKIQSFKPSLADKIRPRRERGPADGGVSCTVKNNVAMERFQVSSSVTTKVL